MRDHLNFLPLSFGRFSPRRVYGGSYRARPPADAFLVKLAAEISMPCNLSVPLKDFGVPESYQDWDFSNALCTVAEVLAGNSQPVYVFCRGGLGRTGLFLACLAWAFGEARPVEYVRWHYHPDAIETQEQERFVDSFPHTQFAPLVGKMGLSPWTLFRGSCREVARRLF